jgi:hypothetical protein
VLIIERKVLVVIVIVECLVPGVFLAIHLRFGLDFRNVALEL